MQAKIIPGCISCGFCLSTCPEVFRMQEDGTAEVYKQPEGNEDIAVKESAEGCPVSVIVIE